MVNPNLGQSKFFNDISETQVDGKSDLNDSNLENLLDRTELRNKILNKMNTDQEKKIKNRKEAILSSMVT